MPGSWGQTMTLTCLTLNSACVPNHWSLARPEDRSVRKTDFDAGCMTAYIYKNISNYRLKMSELIYINYISIKFFKEGETESRLDWLASHALLTPGLNGQHIRTLWIPGRQQRGSSRFRQNEEFADTHN